MPEGIENKLNITGNYTSKRVQIDINKNGKIDADETFILVKGDNLNVSYKNAKNVGTTKFIFDTNNSNITANEQDNNIHIRGNNNTIFAGTGKDQVYVKGNNNQIHDAYKNQEDYEKDVISAQGEDNKFFTGPNGEDVFFNFSKRYNGTKTAIVQDSYSLKPYFPLLEKTDKYAHGDKVESQLDKDVNTISYDIITGTWGKNTEVKISNENKMSASILEASRDKESILSNQTPTNNSLNSFDDTYQYIKDAGWQMSGVIKNEMVKKGVVSVNEQKYLNAQFGKINKINKDSKEFKLDSKYLVDQNILSRKEFDELQAKVDDVMQNKNLTANQRTFTVGALLLEKAGIGDVINKSNTEAAKLVYNKRLRSNQIKQKSINYSDITNILKKDENKEYLTELQNNNLLKDGTITPENIQGIINFDRNKFMKALKTDSSLNLKGLDYLEKYFTPESGAKTPWSIALGNDPEGFSIEAILPGMKTVQGNDNSRSTPRGSFGSLADESTDGIINDPNRPEKTDFGSSFATPKISNAITNEKQNIYNEEYKDNGFFNLLE